ncbi:hydrogenase accessory protein [Thioclava sp. GXIMD4216]|uniref:Hydrogenase accessory protein n=1 Tax=Thioclava litoralis TaxID=3076557 RepID=A0ABZ1DVW2_9RHOB|nr:hydrogenase accessory protein [Thioclava sp. FTW29]
MHDFVMPSDAKPSGEIHPLVQRLSNEFSYPRLATLEAVADFTAQEGVHCLFVPGDSKRNLETPDAAVVLPELRMAFQNLFDCAVIDDAIEAELRQQTRALKTPGFLFYRDGVYLGAIEKIRDWDDYIARTSHILDLKG